MSGKRRVSLLLTLSTGFSLVALLLLAMQFRTARSQEPDRSDPEDGKTSAAELSGGHERTPVANAASSVSSGFELFAGLDDTTVPAFHVDPSKSISIPVFSGVEVWGAAYDYINNQVYVSDGVDLYVWPIGNRAPTFLATVSDTLGINVSMEGLAFYDHTLYASKVGSTGEGEGIYTVDLTTYQATRVIAYLDPSQTTISGIDADPQTGQLYGTNDNAALRGLVRIEADGTVTIVTPYMGTESDIDGLAIGGGRAYLIADDQTPPWFEVWDFSTGAYVSPVPSPFTTTEVFAGGAWMAPLVESLSCNGSAVTFGGGIPGTWTTATATGSVNWALTGDVIGCDNPYEAGGTLPGACADSDTTNIAGKPYDTEMWTNAFDLSSVTNASLELRYRHRQLNNSVFDIDISIDGGATWNNEFSNTTGNPNGAAGDPLALDLANYIGSPKVIARFRYHGSAWDWYAQVDDVSLSCRAPSIEFQKTVGVDPISCAIDDNIIIGWGSDVTYCYRVTNTGNVTFGRHRVVDSELGELLSDFPFSLAPGGGAFFTMTTNVTQTNVNTATWTAFNPGPTDVVFETDSVTVTVEMPIIEVQPPSLAAYQPSDQVSTQALTIANNGDAGLNWALVEAATACQLPSDIPWLSVSPAAGSTAPSSHTVVNVTFDSTGLTDGEYGGFLCVNSDDPVTPQFQLPVSLTVGQYRLFLPIIIKE